MRTNSDGTIVTARDLECTSVKPSTLGACNIDSPCPEWVVKYTKCSKTCGGGKTVIETIQFITSLE